MFYDEPIFFNRNRVFRVYTGGEMFSEFFGDDSKDGNYPEEWVASTVKALNKNSEGGKEGVSKILGTDMYFDDAMAKYKPQMLGSKEDMGYLVKILDSAIRLPMQAHPTRAFSEKYLHSKYGKAESWVILGLRENAKLYFGFNDNISYDEFLEAIEISENSKHKMEEIAKIVDVKVGDVLYIPANTIHAIGYGCLILEVQEPTDFTIQPERWCGDYKLSDYEMYLGLDKDIALKCFNFTPSGNGKIPQSAISRSENLQYYSLIGGEQTDCFSVNKICLNSGKFQLNHDVAVYVVTDGDGYITGDNYRKYIKKGDYFYISHSAKEKFQLESTNMTAIECM